MRKLTGEQSKQLEEVILESFDLYELTRILNHKLERRLSDITLRDNLRVAVHELVKTAIQQGWLIPLLRALKAERPSPEKVHFHCVIDEALVELESPVEDDTRNVTLESPVEDDTRNVTLESPVEDDTRNNVPPKQPSWAKRLAARCLRFLRQLSSLFMVAIIVSLMVAVFVAWLTNSIPMLWRNPIRLTIACGTDDLDEQDACEEGIKTWETAHNGKFKVTLHKHNLDDKYDQNSLDVRLREYIDLLTGHPTQVDIYQIDVTWVGALGQHFYELPERDFTSQHHIPAMIKAGKYNGKLVAAPWSANFSVLYYNKHILKKYKHDIYNAFKFDKTTVNTWDELYGMATTVQNAAKGGITGFIWQGRNYEGLTCNIMEWIYSFNKSNTEDTINRIIRKQLNKNNFTPLQNATSWINTISPDYVLGYNEDDTLYKFRSGEVLYMRHWISAWKEVNSSGRIKGRIGIDLLPKSENGRRATTLGGWLLAVSKYSSHPEAAVELVKYLAGDEAQKNRLRHQGQIPSIASLVPDPGSLETSYFGNNIYKIDLYNVLKGIFSKPSEQIVIATRPAGPADIVNSTDIDSPDNTSARLRNIVHEMLVDESKKSKYSTNTLP